MKILGDELKVGLAQMTPVWFYRDATLQKVCEWIDKAVADDCSLVAFGEACVPGYPFWIEYSKETAFNSPFHKAFHAEYVNQAVCIDRGDLRLVCDQARKGRIAAYLGIIERPPDRGESVYASLVYIDAAGEICSIHRKLMPTYDERMTWSIGDGHGLRVH